MTDFLADFTTDWLRFLISVTAIGVLTAALMAWLKLNMRFTVLIALFRSLAQLTLIAILLRGVNSVPWTVVLVIALMLTTASLTSGSRASELPKGRISATVGVVAGGVITIGIVLATGLIAIIPQEIIAISGITIGACMNHATLALRNFLRLQRAHSGEIEGWYALGATPLEAKGRLRREAIREAVIPNIDQTKSTGLVVLPGAFIGALFGGASPMEAAQFQVLVQAGIMLGGMISATAATWIPAHDPLIPQDRESSDPQQKDTAPPQGASQPKQA